MKGSKKGVRRGDIISVFVSYELQDDDTCSTKKLPIPVSLVYWVHTVVILGTLVGFLAAVVQKLVECKTALGSVNYVGSVNDYVAKNKWSSTCQESSLSVLAD